MSRDASARCPEEAALTAAQGCVGTLALLALTLVFWDPLARFLAWCVLMLAGARPEWPA